MRLLEGAYDDIVFELILKLRTKIIVSLNSNLWTPRALLL